MISPTIRIACKAHAINRILRDLAAQQWLESIVSDVRHPDWSIAADAECLLRCDHDYKGKAIKERVLLWLAGVMSPDKGERSAHAEALINRIVSLYTEEME